jgi:hypothetical protein
MGVERASTAAIVERRKCHQARIDDDEAACLLAREPQTLGEVRAILLHRDGEHRKPQQRIGLATALGILRNEPREHNNARRAPEYGDDEAVLCHDGDHAGCTRCIEQLQYLRAHAFG